MKLWNDLPKRWSPCIVHLHDRLIEAGIDDEGLLFMFSPSDIEGILDANYPHGVRVWYFNETRDREIAEIGHDGYIFVNPQFVWKHLGEVEL